MSYQGLAFVFVLGVGIATVVYHILRGERQTNRPHRNENQNDWIRYGSEQSASQNGCSICIHDIKPEERKKLSCGHTFHTHCIDTWFTKSRSRLCPNCRRSV